MIGINPENWSSLGSAKGFVTSKGLTFTNLWDASNAVWKHYGQPYTSQFWLLDKNGERIGGNPTGFSVSRVEKLLDDLE